MTTIRTPDQRLRVFVSSTIQELAAERAAVRQAIEAQHLIPVLFEMGARPHPPRDLYRAYLDQSHVFVGIYGSSYGWVAPGMDISGLEDEYRLSEGKPRLVYVKHPAPERDARLTTLLRGVQDAGTACYQRYTTADELASLLANDLAVLLFERFESAGGKRSAAPSKLSAVPAVPSLPALPAPLLGRAELLAQVAPKLAQPGLITLTGAGGTGKTSLALKLAHDASSAFADGAYFVALGAVDDPALLAPSIEQSLGMRDNARQPAWQALSGYLAEKRALLVLDNFEQLVCEAPQLSLLLARCSRLTLLVTSRSPLHVRAEQVIEVTPLPVTDGVHGEAAAAVELFVRCATEASPSFVADDATRLVVAEICRRLDGLPLAIELAAAHVRLLPPPALLARMANVLDLLDRGPRDLPERQRALRATIDWSVRLLDEPSQRVFRRLGVFEGGFTLDHAERIGLPERDASFLALAERLMDVGLLRREPSDTTAEPRFSLLGTVRAYALEQLEQTGMLSETRRAHADLFAALAAEAAPHLGRAEREPWLDRLEAELPNLREAFHVLLATRPRALQLFGSLSRLWVMRGHASEAKQWIADARIAEDPAIAPEVLASAHQAQGAVHLVASEFRAAYDAFELSVRLHTQLGDSEGRAFGLVWMGLSSFSLGKPDAVAYLTEAMQLSQGTDTDTFIVAASYIAEGLAARSDFAAAHRALDEAHAACLRTGDYGLLAMTLAQRGNTFLVAGDIAAAEPAYHESLRLFAPRMHSAYRAWTHMGLGFCHVVTERWAEGEDHLRTALDIGRKSDDHSVVLCALVALAIPTFHRGDHATAARLLGGAEAGLERTGFAVWNATRQLIDRVLRLLADREDLALERARGRTLPIEALYALVPPAGGRVSPKS